MMMTSHCLRKTIRTGAVVAVVALTAAGTGCDKAPTRPGASGAKAVTSLQLSGPARMGPGETGQFTLTAHWSDGTNTDVSNQAGWLSSNQHVLSIDAAGKVVAQERGDTVIKAAFSERSSVRDVMVLPPGTHRLIGRVIESVGGTGVEGAHVEVSVGGETITGSSGADGRFRLFGVGSTAALRISKEGYFPYAQSVLALNYTEVVAALTLTNTLPGVSGRYTLTINAAACAGPPPLATPLRQRTYTADVTQTGQELSVTLTGADFAASRFTGRIDGDGATFFFGGGQDYYYTNPFIVERLPDGTRLTFTGAARVRPSDAGLTGSFSGALIHAKAPPDNIVLGFCSSQAHVLTMTR